MSVQDLIAQVFEELVTVAEQRAALVPVFEAVPGVETVKPRVPQAIQAAELPLVILEAKGAVQARDLYDQSLKITRSWEAHVFLQDVRTGYEFEAEEVAEPYLDRLPVVLSIYKQVRLTDGRAFTVLPTGNSIAIQEYGDQTYCYVTQQFQTIVECSVPRLI